MRDVTLRVTNEKAIVDIDEGKSITPVDKSKEEHIFMEVGGKNRFLTSLEVHFYCNHRSANRSTTCVKSQTKTQIQTIGPRIDLLTHTYTHTQTHTHTHTDKHAHTHTHTQGYRH
jgi:hypothetical protein